MNRKNIDYDKSVHVFFRLLKSSGMYNRYMETWCSSHGSNKGNWPYNFINNFIYVTGIVDLSNIENIIRPSDMLCDRSISFVWYNNPKMWIGLDHEMRRWEEHLLNERKKKQRRVKKNNWYILLLKKMSVTLQKIRYSDGYFYKNV